MTLLKFTAPALALFAFGAAHAANQGTLGTSSTGTVNISITIPGLVQITGLSDITLAPTALVAPVTGATSACIYSNTAGGSYSVTATSSNGSSGLFRVNNGSNYIPYSAYWNNTSAATQTTALASGTAVSPIAGGSTTSLTCGGTNNANFNISFSVAQIAGAAPLAYTDTVTLLIAPSV